MKRLAFAVERSMNAKIGVASTTYAAQTSCPASCRFRDGGGCYAEEGILGKTITAPLNMAAAEIPHRPVDVASEEAQAIDKLGRDRQPLRLHTVGDCPDEASALLVADAAYRFIRDGGGPVWTYTHGWRDVPREAWEIVSVLASCETAEDVVAARERGYATSITVEKFPGPQAYPLDSEVTVVPCPAQTKKGVTCSSCRLCFDDAALRERGVTIGFALHGTMLTLRHAQKALRDPDDPDRRLTSRQLIPRYLEEHPYATNGELARALDLNPSTVKEMREKLLAEGLAGPGDGELVAGDLGAAAGATLDVAVVHPIEPRVAEQRAEEPHPVTDLASATASS